MSDVSKAGQNPAPEKIYRPKGPQNGGGYGPTKENEDGLFRDDQAGGTYGPKGPQNDGGYGVRKDKGSDGVTRKDDKQEKVPDPLFTDKVDIQFGKK